MKLLLQSDWQADNMTAPVKQAWQQLRWKGEDVKIYSYFLDDLSFEYVLKFKDYTPIGTVEFVKAFAEKIGVKLPNPIHATELLELEGRDYTVGTKEKYEGYLYLDGAYPAFVKPYDELKKFTGFVARSDKDFDLYPEVDWSTTKLFCTQVLENIVSEWRCYVLNGKVFACVNYSGDPLRFPNRSQVENLLYHFKSQPIAFSLDVAVCKTQNEYFLQNTNLIEINDAYALGYYGGDVELYTKMLNERWKQIVSQK